VEVTLVSVPRCGLVSVDVTVVVADAYPNFSICGIPYHVSGDVTDWRDLAHRGIDELQASGMALRLDHIARHIDVADRRLLVTEPSGATVALAYDRLIVGTGAAPVRPPIAGLSDLGPADGVHLLHTMGDTFALQGSLARRQPESAVIVGAGYIGLEMAEALTSRGLSVTVVEQLPQVLPTLDPEGSALVAEELRRHGVEVVTGTAVQEIAARNGRLILSGDRGFCREPGVVLVVAGVRPDVGLAEAAGARLGAKGALAVDRHMRTNLPDVFAAGDCVQTHHQMLAEPVYLPLGTTAHKQGRVAGENALGGDRQFAGSVGTQVVKVFELAAARTGLRDLEALAGGYDPLTVGTTADDHKRYYPGAQPIAMRLTGDRRSGRLLGLQLVGHRNASVAKRVDIAATALAAGMTVDQINDLDLSYTPPLGSPWDAVQAAAQAWLGEGHARLAGQV
jgi:NADPH-dependent 2,4-dienoyl-CoA reductase/sulfur reductase-like enzyme